MQNLEELNRKLSAKIGTYIDCTGFVIRPDHGDMIRQRMLYNNATVLNVCYNFDLFFTIGLALSDYIMLVLEKQQYIEKVNTIAMMNFKSITRIYLGYTAWENSHLPPTAILTTMDNPFKVDAKSVGKTIASTIFIAFNVQLEDLFNLIGTLVDNYMSRKTQPNRWGEIVLKGPDKPMLNSLKNINSKSTAADILRVLGCTTLQQCEPQVISTPKQPSNPSNNIFKR